MSNLGILLKINIINTLGLNKLKDMNQNEKLKNTSLFVLIMSSIGILFISFYKMLDSMSGMLKSINQMDLLLVIGIIGVVMFNLCNSLYKASTYLYQVRDYEMLSSLPIKSETIFISKLISLILSNYIGSFLIMIVPSIIYFNNMDMSYMFLINMILMFIITPLIPIIMISILTYFIGNISSRSKYKNASLIIGNLLLVLLIMILSYNLDDLLYSLIQNSDSIIDVCYKIYPLSYYFVDGLKNNNIMSVLIYISISIVSFMIFVKIFANSFTKINQRLSEGNLSKDYKVKSLKSSGLYKTLLTKEIKRYLSSYIYVLNTSLSMVIVFMMGASILILGEDKISEIVNISIEGDMLNVQLTFIMLLFILISSTTNSSISLEGKNLWIVKSLPIKEIDILKSKILLNLLLIIPISLLSFMLISFRLQFNISYITKMVILIILCALLTSLYGLFINLKYPKLDYVSETEVVKQSVSAMICAFSVIGYMGIYYALYYFFEIEFNTLLTIGCVMTFFIDIILWGLIKTKGISMFKALS